MKTSLFLFFFIPVLGSHAELICPKTCHCSPDKGASCNKLPLEYSSFPDWVSRLEMKNVNDGKVLEFGDHFFANIGVKNIRSIEIANSSLVSIHEGAFRDLPELRDVNLKDNRIKSIDANTFVNNTKLRHLILSGNLIQFDISENRSEFIKSSTLEGLMLANCKIAQVPPFVFSNLVGLEHIDLSNNKLRSISKNMFAKMESLDEVQLSDNFITDVDPDAFNDILDMTVLKLAGNPLTKLENISVNGLKTLDVSRCKLDTINEMSFAEVEQLSQLNLSSNAISNIDSEAFSGLIKLSFIDLSYNSLTSLPPSLFNENKKLEKISLAGNKMMKKVPLFEGDFTFLEYYDVSGCGIVNLTSESFRTMKYLTTLNISNNQISVIASDAMSKLKNIRVLDVSNNQLKYLNQDLFSENHELTKLYLHHNPLNHISVAAFQTTPKLYLLDASYCQISSIWTESESLVIENSKALDDLAYLNLANNQIEMLYKYQFESLKKLEILDISGNSLRCSNDFAHLIKWLITERIVPNSINSPHPVNTREFELEEKGSIKWAMFLDKVCVQTSTKSPHAPEELDSTMTPNPIIHKKTKEDLKLHRVQVVEIIDDEESYVGPVGLVTLTFISIFIVLVNLFACIIFRTRYQARRVRTSPYSLPLDGHLQIRKGGHLKYQKLYEECSLPLENYSVIRQAPNPV